MLRILACSALVIAAASTPLPAQSPVAEPSPCWRIRSLASCSGFIVTEFSWQQPTHTTRAPRHPVHGYGGYPDFPGSFTWTVGYLGRLSPHIAQGMTASLTAYSGGGMNPSLEWRNRLWLGSSRAHVDIGGGYTMREVWLWPEPGQGSAYPKKAHGLTGSVALVPFGQLGVFARANAVWSRAGVHRGASVGVRSGGPLAVGLTALLAGLVTAASMMIMGGG